MLINAYFPAFGETTGRHVFKQAFHTALLVAVAHLQLRGRPVLLVGDINATAGELDKGKPPSIKRSSTSALAVCQPSPVPAGWFRHWFRSLLGNAATAPGLQAASEGGAAECTALPNAHLVDTFRQLHPTVEGAFTCWSTLTAARKTNFGRRLDYTLLSASLLDQVVDSNIQQDVQGSDHCPVWVDMNSSVHLSSSSSQAWLAQPSGREQGDRHAAEVAAMRLPLPGDGSTNEPTNAAYAPPDSSSRDFRPQWCPPSLVSPLQPPPPMEAALQLLGAPVQSHLGAFFAQASSDTTCILPAAAPAASSALPPAPARRPKRARSASAPLTHFFRSKTARGTSDVHIDLTADDDDEGAEFCAGRSQQPAARSWAQLLTGPPPPPLCKHAEPAIQRTVVKPGTTLGRKFFVCARPEGAHGDPAARCDFFLWLAEHRRGASAPASRVPVDSASSLAGQPQKG